MLKLLTIPNEYSAYSGKEIKDRIAAGQSAQIELPSGITFLIRSGKLSVGQDGVLRKRQFVGERKDWEYLEVPDTGYLVCTANGPVQVVESEAELKKKFTIV